MGSEWTTIGAIAEVFDGPHATPKKIEDGPYFLSISSLDNGKLDLSKSARLSEAQFKKWTRRVTPREGDVLFSYETRLGEAALMPSGIRACLGRRMGLLRPDTSKVDPRYLLFAYLGPDFQGEIQRRTNPGATVDRIALKELPDFPIHLPPLTEQKAIAHILGSLDDKIELNRQMNATLEAMAQALFKSWFIDFGPVLDKALAEGKPIPAPLRERAELRKSLGDKRRPLPPDLQRLFPSRFAFDEELGWIPEGWEAGSIGSIAKRRKEKAKQREVTVLSAVSEGELVPSDQHFTKQVYSKSTEKYLVVRQWDFAYNPSRINIGSIGMLKEAYLGAVSPVYVVITPEYDYRWFLEFYIRSPRFRNWVEILASGSVRQSLSYSNMVSILCVIPTKDVTHAFNKIFEELRYVILANRNQISTLSQLRDTLLPQLISGQLRLPEAEKLVAEAL